MSNQKWVAGGKENLPATHCKKKGPAQIKLQGTSALQFYQRDYRSILT
jgi:hypothetical protein